MAILFSAALAAVLIIIGDLDTLADTTVLLLLFVFVCVNTAVLVLRKDKVDHDHFRAPSILPVLGVAGVRRADRRQGVRRPDGLPLRRRDDLDRDRAVGDQPRRRRRR